jgi:hypothetical protein
MKTILALVAALFVAWLKLGSEQPMEPECDPVKLRESGLL